MIDAVQVVLKERDDFAGWRNSAPSQINDLVDLR
jgi:hypothetical protein